MIGRSAARRPALSPAVALALAAVLICAGPQSYSGAPVAAAPGAPAAGDEFQRGVCYAHIHRRDLGYGSATSRASLARLRGLGVTWISITPLGYQETVRTPRILYRGDPSMRDSALVREMRAVRELGLKSMLKPHIWGGDFYQGRWSGEIRMANEQEWDSWFRSYEAFLLHFAVLAERGGADAFCVGNELGGTTTLKPGRWRALIARVRTLYHGPITYAANWYEEYESVSFWDALDWIGINAYFDLSTSVTPTAGEIERAWAPHAARMEALSRRWRRPVVLTEVGFRSVDRPAAETHGWPEFDADPRPNPEAQRACYEGTFRALWGKPWLRGLYWWKYYTSPGGEGPEEADFTPWGKPAEGVLREYYTAGRRPDDAPHGATRPDGALDNTGSAADHGRGVSSTARATKSAPGGQ